MMKENGIQQIPFLSDKNKLKNINIYKYLDMPNLMNFTKKDKKKIIVYPINAYWLHTGKPELLEKGIVEWEKLFEGS